MRAAALDIAAILIFVAIGRRSHDEDGNAFIGALEVAAPFLLGLAAGWCAARAWRAPDRLQTGIVIWPVTVAVGMVLRHFVFDRGTALSFIIVATVATGVLLLGWRAIAGALANRR